MTALTVKKKIIIIIYDRISSIITLEVHKYTSNDPERITNNHSTLWENTLAQQLDSVSVIRQTHLAKLQSAMILSCLKWDSSISVL